MSGDKMDDIYRIQRHFYDFTRKPYLLGRDVLICELDPPSGGRVLEIGCGTARNLLRISRRYPRALCFGVDISTEKGSNARAVFGGAVHSILEISPTSKTVLIQHGDYFTVYSNLSSVYVNKGDKVQFKQAIGKVRTNDSGKTILKFSVNQSANWFNPAIWINNM